MIDMILIKIFLDTSLRPPPPPLERDTCTESPTPALEVGSV